MFSEVYDGDIWQLFAEQTNIHAIQFLAENPNLKPRSQAKVGWIQIRLK
jgi:hypothetical protein